MAASACINSIGFSPENFFISMSSDQDKQLSDLPDPDLPVADFEFKSLEDPVIMLPADQLFSDGKLIPLHQPTTTAIAPSKPRRRVSVSVADPFAYSSKAPSRWKQLLGFRKNNNNIARSDENGNSSNSNSNGNGNGNGNGATKSIKQFLQRGSKSPNENLNLPLLKDTDNEANEPTSSSSRLSLSSSSSGHDPEELPRVSVDSEKPGVKVNINPPPRMRMVKIRRGGTSSSAEGSVRIDSPRMNSSGKIVFERSSSSPSSLKQRGGMERSYSGNVRVSRVLNVPVCSVRKSGGVFGLPLFSSPQNQKRTEGGGGGGSRKSKTSLG